VSGDGAGHKLWGGRFAGGPAPELEAVNRSITVDYRLWPFDIRLSQAWARGLQTAGVYTADECATVVAGLDAVAKRFAAGEQPIAADEDIHTMVDRLLHEEAGAPAGRLHTGRSRNDQVATDTRLWTLDAITRIDAMLRDVQLALLEQAESHTDAIMPAYTHLQRAQPVAVAHWLLAHSWALTRDRARLAEARDRVAVMPLGSGAIAGSAFPIPREQICADLGFVAISPNSIDAVGDRDFVAEVLFVLSMTGMHLSRLAEDLILYGSSEFGFVKFGDSYSTGSSMMPQKRNPDALELARGAGARVLGGLVAMLATIKGLPSGYNKDLQEDKRSLFDAVDGMVLLLPAVSGSVRTLTFQREKMAAAVSSAMMATDLADYLVRKQVSFREAHGAVGRLVREAEEAGVELTALPFSSFSAAHAAFLPDVMQELLPATSLSHRNIAGGTGPASVAAQLVAARGVAG
jgi:argininosuccinate lyase